MGGALLAEHFRSKEDSSQFRGIFDSALYLFKQDNDIIKTIFITLPMAAFRSKYNTFMPSPAVEESRFSKTKYYTKQYGLIILLAAVAVIQVVANVYGFYLMTPLLLGLVVFPLGGLLVANVPLLGYQIRKDPLLAKRQNKLNYP